MAWGSLATSALISISFPAAQQIEKRLGSKGPAPCPSRQSPSKAARLSLSWAAVGLLRPLRSTGGENQQGRGKKRGQAQQPIRARPQAQPMGLGQLV